MTKIAARMKIATRTLAACAALLLAAAAPAPQRVVMSAQPGSPLDAAARSLVATDLREAARAGETPLLLVGSAVLGSPRDRPVLFVQLQSARECGSSGCSTAAYMQGPKGWRKVLDDVAGPIAVAPERHRGMHDLVVDRHDRWIWNGAAYADTRPAPAVNLRPRHPPPTAARRPKQGA